MTISKKRAEELRAIKDEDIDTSDIPEFGEEFWKKGNEEYPVPKKYITTYYCNYTTKCGTSKSIGFSTEAEARTKAALLAIRGICGIIEKHCYVQEPWHYGGGWYSESHGTGETISQEKIASF